MVSSTTGRRHGDLRVQCARTASQENDRRHLDLFCLRRGGTLVGEYGSSGSPTQETILFSGITRDWMSVVEARVLLAVTFFGVSQTFKANGGDQGQHFAQRFLIVSIPISFKLSLLSWLVFYAASWGITMATLRADDTAFELTMKTFEFAWNIALTGFFFWRLADWMKAARQAGG